MLERAAWVEELRRAVTDAGPGALASGRSAARLWGVRADAPRPEIWGPFGSGPALPGVVGSERHGVPCVDAETMLLQLAAWRTPADVVTAAAAVEVPLDALSRRVDAWLAARGPYPREVRALRDHLDDAARPDSVLETRFLQMLDRAALRNHAVLHHRVEISARVIELDVAFPSAMVVVELDGWTYHRTQASFRSDRERDVHLAALGWVVLRFTHRDVERRPAWVIDQLRRTLAARTTR